MSGEAVVVETLAPDRSETSPVGAVTAGVAREAASMISVPGGGWQLRRIVRRKRQRIVNPLRKSVEKICKSISKREGGGFDSVSSRALALIAEVASAFVGDVTKDCVRMVSGKKKSSTITPRMAPAAIGINVRDRELRELVSASAQSYVGAYSAAISGARKFMDERDRETHDKVNTRGMFDMSPGKIEKVMRGIFGGRISFNFVLAIAGATYKLVDTIVLTTAKSLHDDSNRIKFNDVWGVLTGMPAFECMVSGDKIARYGAESMPMNKRQWRKEERDDGEDEDKPAKRSRREDD